MNLVQPASLAIASAALRTGKSDLLENVETTCDRVDTADSTINALLPESGRRERLRLEASALLKRYPSSANRPPLFGVMVGVKDLYNVTGFPTAAGSLLPPHLFAGPEASAVTTLRKAGALILGKTHTDEFAYSEPSPARNPHNPGHSPGGSSAGSAAAIAAGYCPLALGTQTMRSVIGPAAFCGVVGFKPTHGRVPADGIVYMSPSIDTVGWLVRGVEDALLAARILVPGWSDQPRNAKPALGVPAGSFLDPVDTDARSLFEERLERLASAGYPIRPIQLDDDLVSTSQADWADLLHGEMAEVHAGWFPVFEPLYRPRTANGVRRGQGVAAERVLATRAAQRELRRAVANIMSTNGIDAWVLPSTNGPAPHGLAVTGWVDMTGLWSFASMPCISLPAGTAANGMPLGIQLVAPCGEDERLLGWSGDIADLVREG